MAVVDCAECGGKVSTKAETCPHCGAKVEKPDSGRGWVLRLILVGFVGWIAYQCTSISSQTSSQPAKPFGSSQSGALTLCMDAIKRASLDPATAEVPYVENFGTGSEFYFAWGASTKPLRLKNGFGALLAASGSCTVDSTTGRITSLTINGKSVL